MSGADVKKYPASNFALKGEKTHPVRDENSVIIENKRINLIKFIICIKSLLILEFGP